MLTQFERYAAENREVERDFEGLQDRIDEFTKKLSDQPGLDAVLYEGLSISAGVQNIIEHGLGRAPKGFRIVDVDIFSMFCRDTATTLDRAKFLVLYSTADCTISIEIF